MQLHMFRDLTAQRFGKLQAMWPAGYETHGRNRIMWTCQCDDGNIVIVRGDFLLGGKRVSCGCKVASTIHGENHGRRSTPEYKAFGMAKQRCTNPKNPKYPDYGGRGILFLFENFGQFLAEVGRRPSPNHSIDRINNDRHYEPGNLRWATPKQQSNNQRKTSKSTHN